MNNYDFSNLTQNQQTLLTFQGWTIDFAKFFPQPSEKTVKKLIERGLVIEHLTSWRGMTVREYEVPIDVHAQWCERCSKLNKDEESG